MLVARTLGDRRLSAAARAVTAISSSSGSSRQRSDDLAQYGSSPPSAEGAVATTSRPARRLLVAGAGGLGLMEMLVVGADDDAQPPQLNASSREATGRRPANRARYSEARTGRAYRCSSAPGSSGKWATRLFESVSRRYQPRVPEVSRIFLPH